MAKLKLLMSKTQIVAVILLLISTCSSAHAEETIASLLGNNELRLNTWVVPNENAVVSQRIELVIEVATTRWFAGGTKIDLIEIPDVVILPPEQFANNFSRKEKSKTWTIQQWSIYLYAQKKGEHIVPDITLTISIKGKGSENVQGTVVAPGLKFSAKEPEAMENVNSWVATTSLKVSEVYSKGFDTLAVGDAIERTIRFEIENVPGMMLPPSDLLEIDGLGIYARSPVIQDKSNRGTLMGIKEIGYTYLIEQAGDFHIPDKTFYWWDIKNKVLQTASLPAVDFTVSSLPSDPDIQNDAMEKVSLWERIKNSVHKIIAWLKMNVATFILAVLLLYIAYLVFPGIKSFVLVRWSNHKTRLKASEKKAFNKFIDACKTGDEAKINHLFWLWVARTKVPDSKHTLSQIELIAEEQNFIEKWKAMQSNEYSSKKMDNRKSYSTLISESRKLRKKLMKRRLLINLKPPQYHQINNTLS